MVSDAANSYDNAAGSPCPVVEGSVNLKKVLSLRAADSEGLSARTRNIGRNFSWLFGGHFLSLIFATGFVVSRSLLAAFDKSAAVQL
jgi:hypothetical protein